MKTCKSVAHTQKEEEEEEEEEKYKKDKKRMKKKKPKMTLPTQRRITQRIYSSSSFSTLKLKKTTQLHMCCEINLEVVIFDTDQKVH